MYYGKKNPKYEYRIDDNIVEESKVEKDLGIYISNDVNWNHYINYSINKANKQFGSIKHAFEYIDEYIIGFVPISSMAQ